MSEWTANGQEESGFGAPPEHFDPGILQLYEYWCSKRVKDDIPFRSDMDPVVEIPRLLSAVWLMDIEKPDLRFRYRLLGNDMVSAGAIPKVGDYLDERPKVGRIDETIRAFKDVCRTRRPFWRIGAPHLHHDHLVAGLQLISLPLSVGQPNDVGMLMNMTIYRWQSDAT